MGQSIEPISTDENGSQTGFQQTVWVPPLENPNYDPVPSRTGDGNGASLPSAERQQDQIFVVLPEQMLNAKLQELCNRVPALQRINYRKDASSFMATLNPFRILIPRGELAASKGFIYLVLSLKDGLMQSPALNEIQTTKWELAFKCDLSRVNISQTGFSIERFLQKLSSICTAVPDTEYSSFGRNVDGSQVTWEKWLQTPIGYQSKTNFNLFIGDWMGTCLARNQTSFGHVFEAGSDGDNRDALPLTTNLIYWPNSDGKNSYILIANSSDKLERVSDLPSETTQNLSRMLGERPSLGLHAAPTGGVGIEFLLPGFKELCGDLKLVVESRSLAPMFSFESSRNSVDRDFQYRYDKHDPTQVSATRKTNLGLRDQPCGTNDMFAVRSLGEMYQFFAVSYNRGNLDLMLETSVDFEIYFLPNPAGPMAETHMLQRSDRKTAGWGCVKVSRHWAGKASSSGSSRLQSNVEVTRQRMEAEGEEALAFLQRNMRVEVREVAEFVSKNLDDVGKGFQHKFESICESFDKMMRASANRAASNRSTWYGRNHLLQTNSPEELQGNLFGGWINDIALHGGVKIGGNDELPTVLKPAPITAPSPTAVVVAPVPQVTAPTAAPPPATTAPNQPPTVSKRQTQTREGRLQWICEANVGPREQQGPVQVLVTLQATNKDSVARRFSYLQVKFTASDADVDMFAHEAEVLTGTGESKTKTDVEIVAAGVSPAPMLKLGDAASKKGLTWYTAEVASGSGLLVVPPGASMSMKLAGQRGAENTHKMQVVESWAYENGDIEDVKTLGFTVDLS